MLLVVVMIRLIVVLVLLVVVIVSIVGVRLRVARVQVVVVVGATKLIEYVKLINIKFINSNRSSYEKTKQPSCTQYYSLKVGT